MLKPSEKMLSQLAIDEPIDYSIDSIPLDFANQSQYSDPELEQLFTQDRARDLYVYKINNLVKTKQKTTLNYSQNSIKIGFIDKDEYIKVTGYEISDFNFKLQIQQNTTPQDNSTSYILIDEKDILINDVSKQDKEFLETLDLKIVSINEPITEDNKNECYIIEEYKKPYSPDGINHISSTHLVKITDFKWKNQNSIHLVLQKSLPENTRFIGIEFNYPKSMLFGNIKCWGNIGGIYSYPPSIVQNSNLVPLLSMPIETQPNVRIFQYWFTEGFLPFEIAKIYTHGKDVLELVAINGLERVLLKYLTYRVNYDRKFPGAQYDNYGNPKNKAAELRQKFEGKKPEEVIDGLFEHWKSQNPSRINKEQVKRFKQIIYMLSDYTYSKYAINKGYNDDVKLIAPYYFELLSLPPRLLNEEYWEFKECIVYLKSSYFSFSVDPEPSKNYWTEISATEKPFEELDNKWYFVVYRKHTDSVWSIIKFNHNYFEDDKRKIDKELELWIQDGDLCNKKYGITWSQWGSGKFFKAVYRWNSLDNSEPSKPIVDPKTGEITEWNTIITYNNKNYEITVKNEDISENKLYQLEANYFNWLSLTNELETNNIPSLIPGEINLSNGEYGKYLTNLIVSNENLEKSLNLYSSINKNMFSKSKWVDEISGVGNTNINISFSKNLTELNKIEVSGIWGYGNHGLTIFYEREIELIFLKERIDINNLQLFNKNNEKLSLVTIEI